MVADEGADLIDTIGDIYYVYKNKEDALEALYFTCEDKELEYGSDSVSSALKKIPITLV